MSLVSHDSAEKNIVSFVSKITVCLSVCHGDGCARTAERIDVVFRAETSVCRGTW